MKIFKKKDLVSLLKENDLKEFISDDGNLINSKMPDGNEDEITSDITTDEFIDKTRQRNYVNPKGGYHSMSFGAVNENDNLMDRLPQAIISNTYQLIDSLNDNGINSEQFSAIINFINSKLNNGK